MGVSIRAFGWLVLAAFLIGFLSCLAFKPPAHRAAGPHLAAPSTVSGPASKDWNLPKRI